MACLSWPPMLGWRPGPCGKEYCAGAFVRNTTRPIHTHTGEKVRVSTCIGDW
jgi:hypothetical protein